MDADTMRDILRLVSEIANTAYHVGIKDFDDPTKKLTKRDMQRALIDILDAANAAEQSLERELRETERAEWHALAHYVRK